jgi:hypothetical protein
LFRKARESPERIMPRGKRDYRAEYARRIAHGTAKGISRSQARGHPKPKEPASSWRRAPKPIEDDRLQIALKVLRQEKSLTAAAKRQQVRSQALGQACAGL